MVQIYAFYNKTLYIYNIFLIKSGLSLRNREKNIIFVEYLR